MRVNQLLGRLLGMMVDRIVAGHPTTFMVSRQSEATRDRRLADRLKLSY